MPNLGSIGPVIPEIQNEGNVCVGVCACVYLIYEDGRGLIIQHISSNHQNKCMVLFYLSIFIEQNQTIITKIK